MEALRLLMTNNVFQFGDTYWLQKVEKYMVAPPTPPWATILFGMHKEAVLAQFGDMLQLYCRFIVNILRIWLVNPNPAEYHRKWTALTLLMQDYCGIKWIFKERSKKVNILDMTISICKDRIFTWLHKKSMNVYLYIPPNFTHPLWVLTGLVSGNIICIHLLWSNDNDINHRMREFYARFIVCSYHHDLLIAEFTKGITWVCSFSKRGASREDFSDKEKDM